MMQLSLKKLTLVTLWNCSKNPCGMEHCLIWWLSRALTLNLLNCGGTVLSLCISESDIECMLDRGVVKSSGLLPSSDSIISSYCTSHDFILKLWTPHARMSDSTSQISWAFLIPILLGFTTFSCDFTFCPIYFLITSLSLAFIDIVSILQYGNPDYSFSRFCMRSFVSPSERPPLNTCFEEIVWWQCVYVTCESNSPCV